MRDLKFVTLCTLLWLGLLNCQADRTHLLVGSWEAHSLTSQGDTLAVNIEDIGFVFHPDGRYSYRSTIQYKESGRYWLDGAFLFSQDTLQNDAVEKAVEVLLLNNDSLHLRMFDEGEERLLKLSKR